MDRALESLRNRERVLAYDSHFRYDFFSGCYGYLSDRLGHILALFQTNGFVRSGGEVCLDWDDFEVEPVKAPFDVEVVGAPQFEGPPRPVLKNRALLNGDEVGYCTIGSCGRWSQAEEVQDRFLVDSLNVKEPYQGKGLGHYLYSRPCRMPRSWDTGMPPLATGRELSSLHVLHKLWISGHGLDLRMGKGETGRCGDWVMWRGERQEVINEQ